MQPQYIPKTSRFKDMTGQRFGRLVALNCSGLDATGRAIWLCQCDCGQTTNVPGKYLRKGHTKSCGCLRDEGGKNWYKHGMAETRVFGIWMGMIDRCTNPNTPSYSVYGGKGVTVCDSWLHSFETFYADMGEPPSQKHSIDRIDSNGNYEQCNCRWATSLEQGRNTSRVRQITYNDKTLPLSEWAEIIGINRRTLYDRIFKLKWAIERAMLEPVS